MNSLESTIILTTTNDPYVKIAKNLVASLGDHHPEVQLFVSCVNVSNKNKDLLMSLHKNINLLEEDLVFETIEKEKNYSAHNRVWLMHELMEKYKKNVLWLDGDVFLKRRVDDFFNWLSNYDFSIRAKAMNPYRCNCGIVWSRYSEKNISILKEWEEEARKLDIYNFWYADQYSLNSVMDRHINVLKDIEYSTFPEEFDGKSNNPITPIVHMKGPKQL